MENILEWGFITAFFLKMIWGIVHPIINKDSELRGHYVHFWIWIVFYLILLVMLFPLFYGSKGWFDMGYPAFFFLNEVGLWVYLLWISVTKGRLEAKVQLKSQKQF